MQSRKLINLHLFAGVIAVVALYLAPISTYIIIIIINMLCLPFLPDNVACLDFIVILGPRNKYCLATTTNLYFTVTCYISVDATLWSVCNPLAFVSWINKALSIYLSLNL